MSAPKRTPDQIVREADMAERANKFTRADMAEAMAALKGATGTQASHYERLRQILSRGQPPLKKWARGAPGARGRDT